MTLGEGKTNNSEDLGAKNKISSWCSCLDEAATTIYQCSVNQFRS